MQLFNGVPELLSADPLGSAKPALGLGDLAAQMHALILRDMFSCAAQCCQLQLSRLGVKFNTDRICVALTLNKMGERRQSLQPETTSCAQCTPEPSLQVALAHQSPTWARMFQWTDGW